MGSGTCSRGHSRAALADLAAVVEASYRRVYARDARKDLKILWYLDRILARVRAEAKDLQGENSGPRERESTGWI